MKPRAFFLLPLLLPLASLAQDAAPPRELIIAAVGEIPVPKMKVTEVNGRRGYEADQESTQQWFPKEWSVAGKPVPLALNLEPVAMKLSAGIAEVSLAPDAAPPKSQTLPAVTGEGPTMMIVFNREPEKTWTDGFGTRFVTCSKLDSASPAAVVLNLSGATVSIISRDRSRQEIAPGKFASAPLLVNTQSGVKLLPLSVAAGDKSYPLDVTPLDVRAPWCPVVVVYPSVGPSSKSRPLKVSVIQPSAAVRVDKPAAAPVAN